MAKIIAPVFLQRHVSPAVERETGRAWRALCISEGHQGALPRMGSQTGPQRVGCLNRAQIMDLHGRGMTLRAIAEIAGDNVNPERIKYVLGAGTDGVRA